MFTPKKRIALTPGAENGVGPELLLKALKAYKNIDSLEFLWCGDRASLELASRRTGISINFTNENSAQLDFGPELVFFADQKADCVHERQATFLKKSIELAQSGSADAIVTGPIDKAALKHLDQGKHAGQTEYFAEHLAQGDSKPCMAFFGGPFVMSLLTTHLPLSKVASSINSDLIIGHLRSIAHHKARLSGKDASQIKISVLGINPHAGEGGLLGLEEEEIVKPAIIAAQKMGLKVRGPEPADGFFTYLHKRSSEHMPDVVVAAYHDQGLIPYKLLAQGRAVNVTLGLRVPRTSPAHGTAHELAGKNMACSESTEMAIKLAIELLRVNP